MPEAVLPRAAYAPHGEIRLINMAIAYFALAGLVYYVYADAVLDGYSDLQFYADSPTYEEAYRNMPGGSWWELTTIGGNYLGPVFLLTVFGGSRLLIFLFNIVAFCAGMGILFRTRVAERHRLALLIGLNPMTFCSLLSVNKEIFAFLSIALLISYYYERRWTCLVGGVIFGLLTRWQFAFFALLYFLMVSPANPCRKYRLAMFLLLLLGVSALYPRTSDLFASINEIAELGGMDWGGSGLFIRFIEIQNAGGYFLIFVPKTLHVMFAMSLKINQITDWTAFYPNVVVTTYSLWSFVVFSCVIIQRRFTLKHPLVYMFLIYCVIFTLTPIYSPRYFYAAFIIMCVVAASHRRALPSPVHKPMVPSAAG
jgi:hypothetical protein